MINDKIRLILNLLQSNKFEAYLVGGCVRDFLMNIKTYDIDIATNARPEQIIDIFKEYKTIDIGRGYGTIIVLTPDYNFDITTYRIDGNYLLNRRPKGVQFANELKEDIKRRDFTVNAIAYNGEIIDYYGGINDINNKIINCVGNPKDRIKEDALRILRAVRFSCRLGFEIEENTKNAIYNNLTLLNNISSERKQAELLKILESASPNILKYKEIISYTIFNNSFETLDINENTLLWISNLDKNYLKLVVFLKDTNISLILTRLKFAKKTIEKCYKIQGNLDIDIKLCETDIKLWLFRLGTDVFEDILYINITKNLVFGNKNDYYKKLEEIYHNIKNDCYDIKTLNISGNDLIELGIRPGKNIGEILNYLLKLVIYKKVPNEIENLKLYAKKYKGN